MDNGIVDEKILLAKLRGVMENTVKEESGDFVRRKKMYVTEGAHTDSRGRKVLTVQEAFGEAFEVPYAPSLYAAQPGDSVWVEWVYGFGNACAVNSGAWQASDLPTCVVPTEDGLIMQVDFKPVMVISTAGVSMDADTLEVSGHIQGDVVNTSAGKNVTVNGKIQDTVDSLGKYLNGDVNITVPAGTYVEDVVLEGFEGNGALNIIMNAQATVKGDWTMRGCRRVTITGHTETVGEDEVTSSLVGVIEDAAMDIGNCGYVEIGGVEIHGMERATGEDGQEYGVRVSTGTYAYIHDCMIDRTQTAVYVEHAHLDIKTCEGGAFSDDAGTVANLVNGVVISPDGGNVNAKGTIPAGPDSEGTGYEANGYPFTCAGTVSPVVSGGEAPPEITEVTSTWTSTGGYYCSSYKTGVESWQGRGTGWKGDGTFNLRMGYNSSDQKYMAGIWVFQDADTIALTLRDVTIKKATVSLTRSGANGAASGTVVTPYYHNLRPQDVGTYSGQCDPWAISSGSGDKYNSCGCPSQYINYGQTGTFELPSFMFDALKNGNVKGFGIGMNHQSPFFQFVPTGCVLTVTYEV